MTKSFLKSNSKIFFFIIFAFIHSNAFGKTLNFRGDEIVPIGHFSSMFIDHSNSLEFKDIRRVSKFKNVSSKYLNLGFVQGTVWLKFKVKNQTKSKDLKLEIDYPFLDQLVLYSVDDENKINELSTNEFLKLSKRSIPYFGYIFNLNLPPGQTKFYFLKVNNKEPLTIPARILTPRQFYVVIDLNILWLGY